MKFSKSLPKQTSADSLFEPRKTQRGFSLVEVMIATAIFITMAAGISSVAIQSQRMSYQAVYQNAAFNAAQGFLEQMRSMPYVDFNRVFNSPNSELLDTVSSINSSSLIVEDPLKYHPTNSSTFDAKSITIDIQNERPITMEMRFRMRLNDLQSATPPVTAFEVTLEYDYEVPSGTGTTWHSNRLVTVISKHEI